MTSSARQFLISTSVFLLLLVGAPVALALPQAPQDAPAAADETLPLPQTDGDQPAAVYDEAPNPAPVPGGTEDVYEDEEEEAGTPNIDALRIASLSVWLGANAAFAAGYTGAGFFVEGPLAVIWGAFGGAFLLAPLGAAIGAGIGAIVGLVLWTASADAPDRPETDSPMEVFLRQVDRLLRGAQAATLGILITAGSASVGGLLFALGGGVAGGLLSENPGFLRQSTYVAAGLSVLVTSVGIGVGAYFAHLQLDRFGEPE